MVRACKKISAPIVFWLIQIGLLESVLKKKVLGLVWSGGPSCILGNPVLSCKCVCVYGHADLIRYIIHYIHYMNIYMFVISMYLSLYIHMCVFIYLSILKYLHFYCITSIFLSRCKYLLHDISIDMYVSLFLYIYLLSIISCVCCVSRSRQWWWRGWYISDNISKATTINHLLLINIIGGAKLSTRS